MLPFKAVTRRMLDGRLAGLCERVGPRPECGWIRAIRDALGMSTFELGERMGVTPSRVRQMERAEAAGSMELATLERAARALNCRFCYVIVPNEPLELMVRHQALEKAAGEVAASTPEGDPTEADRALFAAVMAEQVEARAHELIDRRGLWRAVVPRTRPERA
jgi:predicted DNA-binding mobile mystery protein A